MSDLPQLVARFATDEHGDPKYITSRTGRKHYRIVIEVENPPSDLLAATFELDPTTYSLPLRTVEPDVNGRLLLETTAYGDYGLKVDLRSRAGIIPVSTTLKKALLSGEPADRAPKIAAAIAEIAAR